MSFRPNRATDCSHRACPVPAHSTSGPPTQGAPPIAERDPLAAHSEINHNSLLQLSLSIHQQTDHKDLIVRIAKMVNAL
jgi:hypothetical protein